MVGRTGGQLAEVSRLPQLLRRVLLFLAAPLLLALPLLPLVPGVLEGSSHGRMGAGTDAATSLIAASAAVRFLASPPSVGPNKMQSVPSGDSVVRVMGPSVATPAVAAPSAEPNSSSSCNETGLNATNATNCTRVMVAPNNTGCNDTNSTNGSCTNATDVANFTGCNDTNVTNRSCTNATDISNLTGCNDTNATNGSCTNATDVSNFTGCNSTNATNGSNGTGCNGSAPQPLLPDHVPWIKGTWTTGYWDCCKPSCSWPRKGKVDRPTLACSAATGERLSDSNERSVCDGGLAGSCSNHQPFLANKNLAFGFAAAAVSGNHGLMGDDNCGQCFELKFVRRMHGGNVWGGAHPKLVNRSMVVQVTNIGYDVTGSHSFDLQIPGAGQGIFTGCSRQYPGFRSGDFDCDTRYGGCSREAGCARLPSELQPGCHWRYSWFHWLEKRGQTNNPWVHFRRVRCPRELVAISGSTPDDDDRFRPVAPEEYA